MYFNTWIWQEQRSPGPWGPGQAKPATMNTPQSVIVIGADEGVKPALVGELSGCSTDLWIGKRNPPTSSCRGCFV